MFSQDAPARLEELQAHLAALDAKKTEIVAHAIKGAASSVCGEQVRSLAFELETAAKADDLAKVASRMADFRVAMDCLIKEIKNWSES